MRVPRFSIAIPASMISDVPGLQLKTYKIGQVARALAIYCVGEIIVYPDQEYGEQRKDMEFISRVLRYMETPQYLRKELFPLSPMLKYAGTLPPLNTPHHPTHRRIAELQDEEIREGFVVSHDSNGSLVDIGMERPLRSSERLAKGRRTFRVRKYRDKEFRLELVDSSEISQYWGYKVVESSLPLGQLLRKKTYDLQILTSRLGVQIPDLIPEIEDRLKKSRKVLIAFGSPKEGLKEILGREALDQNIADYFLNTVPDQGTLSIRTEEAIHATLAIINLLTHNADIRFIRPTS
jgi:predicted SPOUT superfamily RNA methylase MTH1